MRNYYKSISVCYQHHMIPCYRARWILITIFERPSLAICRAHTFCILGRHSFQIHESLWSDFANSSCLCNEWWVLNQQMEYYSNDASVDQINRMKGELSQVCSFFLQYFLVQSVSRCMVISYVTWSVLIICKRGILIN